MRPNYMEAYIVEYQVETGKLKVGLRRRGRLRDIHKHYRSA